GAHARRPARAPAPLVSWPRLGFRACGVGRGTGAACSGCARRGSIPIVQKIRHDCAEPFTAFEQCLKQNQASVMNCKEHLNQFLLCAEQVKLMT
uniref:Uncharacterized protein n=1 Tax=Chelonoidis abingdonii TaxID=106734 RepID=A0A8C0J994_CHEAB